MGRNEFQHVRAGEPLQIPAATYNAMVDAAQAHRNRRINLAPHGGGFDSLFVYVVNTTGQSLQRFNVVGLDGPSETQNLDVFCSRIVFKGVKPQKKHKGKFAVLQQDAANNMVVRACVYGATIAKVKTDSSSSELKFCDIKENETGYLVSGGSGAEVLWSDNSSQERWSIIRIGSGGFTIYKGKLASKCSAGASTVRVKPEEGETITVDVPYPNDLKECPEGHLCRYYADGDDWTLLDIACPKET